MISNTYSSFAHEFMNSLLHFTTIKLDNTCIIYNLYNKKKEMYVQYEGF